MTRSSPVPLRRSVDRDEIGAIALLFCMYIPAKDALAVEGRLEWKPSSDVVDGYMVYFTPIPIDLQSVDVGMQLSCSLSELDLDNDVQYYLYTREDVIDHGEERLDGNEFSIEFDTPDQMTTMTASFSTITGFDYWD